MLLFGIKIPTAKRAETMLQCMQCPKFTHLTYCEVTAWDELDQRVIDTAVSQWRTRLRVCVKAKGGHFKYKLSQ